MADEANVTMANYYGLTDDEQAKLRSVVMDLTTMIGRAEWRVETGDKGSRVMSLSRAVPMGSPPLAKIESSELLKSSSDELLANIRAQIAS